MTAPHVLPPMPVLPVKRISPSRYGSLVRCNLNGIWYDNHLPALLPLPAVAKLGIVAHKLIEMVNRGQVEDAERANTIWDGLVRKIESEMASNWMERHLVPLEEKAGMYNVRKLMAMRLLSSLFKARAHHSGWSKPAETELWLETPDKKVGGRVDQMRHSSKGVAIVDYKTGLSMVRTSRDDDFLSEYGPQLKLYAAVYEEVTKEWPVSLLLIGPDAVEQEIAFEATECMELLRQAKELLTTINSRINDGETANEMANPSPESCKFCVHRPGCLRYREDAGDPDDGWPCDMSGEVTGNTLLGNGLRRIMVETRYGSTAIRGLSPERHMFLEGYGAKVLFCNLKHDTSTGRHYVETPTTTSFVIEQ